MMDEIRNKLLLQAIIDTSDIWVTSMLVTYYLNFSARQLYVQNRPNFRKIQYLIKEA